ncbi:hypothetical protein N9L94_04575 [Robiginitalea sp.]|nr:hypothetical protein [Robiginitalea sp.]
MFKLLFSLSFLLCGIDGLAQQVNDFKITPSTIKIMDNIERVILDYSISEDLGLNQMVAPPNWTEPIVALEFEIRGIVLQGVLGLEFAGGTHLFVKNDGFIIPTNTKVRIFNAGEEQLHIIEVLRPAYQERYTTRFDSFE